MHFIVTFKLLPPVMHSPDDKKAGACAFSPTCTDRAGAHHSIVMDALNYENIREWATHEGMHVTRIEEIFFIKSIPGEYDVPVSGGQLGVDGREADGGSTRLSSAHADTTFDLSPATGPLVEYPITGICSGFNAAREVEEDRARRRVSSGD